MSSSAPVLWTPLCDRLGSRYPLLAATSKDADQDLAIVAAGACPARAPGAEGLQHATSLLAAQQAQLQGARLLAVPVGLLASCRELVSLPLLVALDVGADDPLPLEQIIALARQQLNNGAQGLLLPPQLLAQAEWVAELVRALAADETDEANASDTDRSSPVCYLQQFDEDRQQRLALSEPLQALLQRARQDSYQCAALLLQVGPACSDLQALHAAHCENVMRLCNLLRRLHLRVPSPTSALKPAP